MTGRRSLEADADAGPHAPRCSRRAVVVYLAQPEASAVDASGGRACRELRAVGRRLAPQRAHIAHALGIPAPAAACLAEAKIEPAIVSGAARGDEEKGSDSGSHTSSWGPLIARVKTPRRGDAEELIAWR